MESSVAWASRVEALEMKVTYQEAALAELSAELFERTRRVERLEETVARMASLLRELAPGARGEMPAGERPPHW